MTKQELSDAMDKAATDAMVDLQNTVPQQAYFQVATWWKKHYLSAGHKRLGRVMVSIAKELSGTNITDLDN